MALNNPQSSFEDSIFGPGGTHPAPKTLPYSTQPLKTLYGETIEYLIPDGQKEKVLKKLFPFGEPPPMGATWMDIHEHKEFVIRDFKVIQQGDYVLLVSPYFAHTGGSVVDWEPVKAAKDGVHVAAAPDELCESAYSAGHADGFTGMPKGTAKPSRQNGVSDKRYGDIEEAYNAGFEDGVAERMSNRAFGFQSFASEPGRRSGRRPH